MIILILIITYYESCTLLAMNNTTLAKCFFFCVWYWIGLISHLPWHNNLICDFLKYFRLHMNFYIQIGCITLYTDVLILLFVKSKNSKFVLLLNLDCSFTWSMLAIIKRLLGIVTYMYMALCLCYLYEYPSHTSLPFSRFFLFFFSMFISVY